MDRNNKKIPVTELKPLYKERISSILKDIDKIEIDENDTISLFHGTSSYYLNEILTFGLLTRKENEHNNWENNPSFEELTYLTKKWQYIYGYASMMELFKKEDIPSYPCYVEFKVPKALLVSDEDFINTNYMINKIKRNKGVFEMTWEESLAHHGTVAYLGSIPRKYLESFTIIGDFGFIEKYIVNYRSDYMLDYNDLQSGRGKGKRVNWMNMIERESKSNRNATWFTKDFKINTTIDRIFYDEDLDKTRCAFAINKSGGSLRNAQSFMDSKMEEILNMKNSMDFKLGS